MHAYRICLNNQFFVCVLLLLVFFVTRTIRRAHTQMGARVVAFTQRNCIPAQFHTNSGLIDFSCTHRAATIRTGRERCN